MPDFENRQPREDINVSTRHPLKTFGIYAVSAVLLVVLMVVTMQFAGGFVARQVPFSVETRLMDRLDMSLGSEDASPQMLSYLNELAARLLAQMDTPDDMRVLIHYNDQQVFNAFATLGGNLLFYRGLLERLPNENALAMVLAHEIAHVLHRDPAAGLGGGVASALVLAGLTGNAGTAPASSVLSRAGVLTGMQFTRRMEIAADRTAVAAVGALYGHTDGASALFTVIAEERQRVSGGRAGRATEVFERFLATHPVDADRIRAIEETSLELGIPVDGETTPLPEDFSRWL